MLAHTQKALEEFCAAEDLPADYSTLAKRWFAPLAEHIRLRYQSKACRLLVGVHGAQGTGKTTLCRVLELLLAERGVRAVTLSLDDFYLGRAARQQLAETVHPLLATRGVPGTHDVGLLENTLDRLLSGGFCEVPRFDKSRDDRVVKTKWMEMGGADIVLLEGWCVGCIAESEAALVEPVNRLEAEEDADGSWRRYVNQRLNGEYAGLFARLDYLLMLEAPSLDAVLEWRTQQEQKLALKMPGRAVMSDAAIRRFVQHYQRITLNSLAALPARADYVLRLGEDHRPKSEWPMIGRSVDLLVAGEVLKNTP